MPLPDEMTRPDRPDDRTPATRWADEATRAESVARNLAQARPVLHVGHVKFSVTDSGELVISEHPSNQYCDERKALELGTWLCHFFSKPAGGAA